jgi:hypothetical protein
VERRRHFDFGNHVSPPAAVFILNNSYASER